MKLPKSTVTGSKNRIIHCLLYNLYFLRALCIFGPKGAIQIRYYYYYYFATLVTS